MSQTTTTPTAGDILKKHACMVLRVTFYNNPTPRSFYSKDKEYKGKYYGNTVYWFSHLKNLAEKTWAGRVASFAIFYWDKETQSVKGDPIIRVKY